MIANRDDEIQSALYNTLTSANLGVPVTTEPTAVQDRYVRIDSFTALDDDIYKNRETTTHSFTVHVFDAPDGGAKSFRWVRQMLGAIDTVIRASALAGGSARRQDFQVLFEPTTAEGVFDAHGFIRYSVQIGA